MRKRDIVNVIMLNDLFERRTFYMRRYVIAQ